MKKKFLLSLIFCHNLICQSSAYAENSCKTDSDCTWAVKISGCCLVPTCHELVGSKKDEDQKIADLVKRCGIEKHRDCPIYSFECTYTREYRPSCVQGKCVAVEVKKAETDTSSKTATVSTKK